MQNSVVSTQILAKIFRPRVKECAYIKFSSIMTKSSGNCFYMTVYLLFALQAGTYTLKIKFSEIK